jgi:hypothetical protein
MIEYQIKSVSELIDCTKELGTKFKCNYDEIWYRGVPQESYKLIPGFYRNIVEEKYEKTIITDFRTHYKIYSDAKTDNDMELYSLMQHYGLPTRLLDWSKSPLIALYFALEKINREITKEPRIVWAINPAELNLLSVNKYQLNYLEFDFDKFENIVCNNSSTIAITPSFTNKRIIAQKGQFTIHFSPKPIEQLFTENNSNEIAKIIIENDDLLASFIREDLYALGFKEDDIYQDLNSLSNRIKRERKGHIERALNMIPMEVLKKLI